MEEDWYNPWTWGSDAGEAQFSPPPPPMTPEEEAAARARAEQERAAAAASRPAPGTTTTSRMVNPYSADDTAGMHPDQVAAIQSQLERGNAGVEGILQSESLQLQNEGTTYERLANTNPNSAGYNPYGASGGFDQRNYMYGRTPGGADLAVDRAWDTGSQAQQFGMGVYGQGQAMLGARGGEAASYRARGPQYGDFSAQTQTLDRLGGLEATQGPSAAQAQLQAGSNQAMAQQLALARSGRGFGGNAAAMGLAQGNMAQITGNQATSAAQLRAQEDAAWRARQAQNLGTVAGAQGQQAATNLQAYYQNQGQNDAAALQSIGLGQQAYFQGAGVGQGGYGQNLQAQGLAAGIRGQEMTGGMAQEDNILREWAARNGYNLAQQQRQDQKEAGYIAAGSSLLAGWL